MKKKTRVILFGGEKGGTGKTTLAVNMAAMSTSKGLQTMLLDCDPQQSASDWALLRDESEIKPHISCMQKLGEGVNHEIRHQIDMGIYDYIIVDAGGRDSNELRSVLTCAHLLISPLQASQFDIWTITKLNKLLSSNKIFNPNLAVKILINCASTHHKDSDAVDGRKFISDDFPHLSVANTIIHDRSIFRKSVGKGMAIIEDSNSTEKAISEISSLYAEVFGHEF